MAVVCVLLTLYLLMFNIILNSFLDFKEQNIYNEVDIEDFCKEKNVNLIGKTFVYFFLIPYIICFYIKKIIVFIFTNKK